MWTSSNLATLWDSTKIEKKKVYAKGRKHDKKHIIYR